MPVDHERQRDVRRAVKELRAGWHDRVLMHGTPIPARNLAELIGLLVAECRARGADEVFQVEITLRAADFHREELSDAELVLRALGYVEISALLRRLARRAEPRPTLLDRVRARQAERAAIRAGAR
jgi:hypothetical protein